MSRKDGQAHKRKLFAMTKMRQETEEIPAAAERLLKSAPETIAPIAQAFRTFDPHVVVTIARGSSDHAAYFLKYAIELMLGLPVASLGPSIAVHLWGPHENGWRGKHCHFPVRRQRRHCRHGADGPRRVAH